MKTKNSIKNSITSVISNIVSMLIGFVGQAVFIRVLGTEYLGINGLFTNILTMLSIFELGVGNAIVFNLYKPIVENNQEKIKSYMRFYRKSYNIIALIILLVGISIIPFLAIIVGNVTNQINIYIVYLLCLFATISSYLVAYKRSLLYANQKSYIINIIHTAYLLGLNISQIIILLFTKNYYLYLVVKIVFQLFENILISVSVNKRYPYIMEKNVVKITKEQEKDIFKKVRALICHKVGTVIVYGTDNIIISAFFGVTTVGLYSNYSMVINAINNLFSQIISSTTASIGHMLVNNDEDKIFDVFKKIRFINFWLAAFSSVCLLVIMQPFIIFWVGERYLLNFSVLCILIFNSYQKIMRNVYKSYKDSAGIWENDKYVPLIESCLNIIFSIVCLKIFGLKGVFLGTIISGLSLWCYSYPKFVYKGLFKRSYYDYFKETVGYILVLFLISYITYNVSLIYVVNNNFVKIIINSSICLLVPNFLLYLIFRKSDNYKYFEKMIINIIYKSKSKSKYIAQESL